MDHAIMIMRIIQYTWLGVPLWKYPKISQIWYESGAPKWGIWGTWGINGAPNGAPGERIELFYNNNVLNVPFLKYPRAEIS